ncbi:MAG: protein translocase subunit SecF, partial [Nocardia sp.]|nr:protein translocase subunit SecF [Nocardia sp.]
MNDSVTMDKPRPSAPRASGPRHSWMNRLYTGTGVLDVVGNRRRWYLITAAIVLICLLSMALRGFTFGIDFVGGSRIQLPAGDVTTEQVEQVYSDVIGSDPESVQTVGTGDGKTILIRSETLNAEQLGALQTALFDQFQPRDDSGNPSRNAISASDVSETWGGQITRQALIALAVFLVLVSVYIGIRYERDMALAALAALVFDLLVTAGVYSLVGFEVTPAMVIGMLTILGFSLYDSVVVFDKVEENTRGVLHTSRRTYGEQANLAINQTLMRSINTTLIGALPIIGLMVIAVWMLGVGTLQDLALVQLVGTLVGAYSSIFFATPLLVSIKERWGPVAAHTRKVHARRAAQASGGPVP